MSRPKKKQQGASAPPVELPPLPPFSVWKALGAGLLILLPLLLAYVNSFHGSFMLDDAYIKDTEALHTFWHPAPEAPFPWLFAPENITRPLIGVTLALNYAWGGLNTWGYHVVNFSIHFLAALTLFGILRRTLRQPVLRERFGLYATPLALTIAILWAVHPLQTQAVTYIIQRAEEMMGLFYLVTLYCFIRGTESPTPKRWYILAVLACALGTGCKQVIVTAPLIVLLYDRFFVAGTFGKALKLRWPTYAGLAASWVLIVAMSLAVPSFKAAGFHLPISSTQYALSQLGVILHYLQLSLWPETLCLDYKWPLAEHASEIIPGLIVVGGLGLWTLRGLFRSQPAAFLGAWFFLILAPTSSIMPIQDLLVEHRMYLSLAAVITLLVLGAFLLGRIVFEKLPAPPPAWAGWVLAAIVVIPCGGALTCRTILRNEVYRTEESIWREVIADRPENARAYYNLGKILADMAEAPPEGRSSEKLRAEAIELYQKAIKFKPQYGEAFNNWGRELHLQGHYKEAIPKYLTSLGLSPNDVNTRNNLVLSFKMIGKTEEEAMLYVHALRITTDFSRRHNLDLNLLSEAHNFMGLSQIETKHWKEAKALFELALREKPDSAEIQKNLNDTLEQMQGMQ